MKEYKFRGKTLEDFKSNDNVIIPRGTWIYGGIVYDDTRVWIDTVYYGQIAVDKETVGQYTGLHDKNGKEIYEGDIVSFNLKSDSEGQPYIIGYIEYQTTFSGYRIMSFEGSFALDYNIKDIEVIGNIYENKELLNETNR